MSSDPAIEQTKTCVKYWGAQSKAKVIILMTLSVA